MTWQCFGWTGGYCHTGRDYYASERDGICVEDHDQDYDPPSYPFSFCFVILNQPSSSRLNRKIVSFFEGVEFGSYLINNSWNWARVTTTLEAYYHLGRYRFELQDRDGNVLCSRNVFLGEITEDVPDIDDPIEEDIPFDEIVEGVALVVNAGVLKTVGEINENQNLINGIQNSVNDMNTGLNEQINDVSQTVSNGLDVLENNINGSLGGYARSFAKGLSDIAGRVSAIKVPSIADIKYAFLDVCGDLAVALWEEILDRIEARYPDDKEESD